MADVHPFRGLRYSQEKVKDLGSAMSPPYDVISQGEQDALHARNPYNIVRLELAQSGGTDAYAEAGATLREWLRERIIVQDERPAFYVARHEFTYLGRKMARTEVTAAVRLEELSKGIVRPHEATRSKAKEDRLRLMRATGANISPVMLLYDGQEFPKPKGPRLEARLPGEGRFLFWPMVDAESIGRIQRELLEKPLYIADGHHRYETALAYRDEVHAKPDDAASFVMATLISFADPGLLVLPYHRLLNGLDSVALGLLGERLEALCMAERLPVGKASRDEIARLAMDALSNDRYLFALWGMEPGCLLLLSLANIRAIDEIAARGHSRAWAGLANCIFREAILSPVLGLQEEEAEARGLLSFAKNAAEAVEAVDAGSCQIAVLCKAVPFAALKEVSDRGERLPPKSTFFHPKLPTGLVLKSLQGPL